MCIISNLCVSVFIRTPIEMCVCGCLHVCLCVTWQASHLTAPPPAVRSLLTVQPLPGQPGSGKTTWNNFKNYVSERKAREWKRLSHFLHRLSCNWRLSSQPVGGSRGEVERVKRRVNRVHVKAKSSHATCDNRSVSSIIMRLAVGAKADLFSTRQTWNYLTF